MRVFSNGSNHVFREMRSGLLGVRSDDHSMGFDRRYGVLLSGGVGEVDRTGAAFSVFREIMLATRSLYVFALSM